MKVDILASGSSGNCIAIKTNDHAILVDCGIAKTKIEKRLLDVGIRPDSIKAIFITHAHSDHVKGLSIANKYFIPVFAGEEEWKSINGVDNELKYISDSKGIMFDFEGFGDVTEVIPFNTHHDAFEPKGYSILSNNEKVSICLDTGLVDSIMLSAMKNSNIYIIESNHEPNMVEVSSYPNSVKARILSHVGHLSNEQTAEALSHLVKGVGEQIYLTHLSSKNNLPALAEMTVKRALAKKGFKAGTDYYLEVV